MVKKTISIFILQFIILPASAWTFKALDGVQSNYTLELNKIISSPNSESISNFHKISEDISFLCIKDAKDDLYIGMGQLIEINASVEKVSAYFEQFENYPKWFDGLEKVQIEKNNNGNIIVKSEQVVPVPFVPNIKTEMIYEIQKEDGNVLLRYQLLKSSNLKKYDGFILISPKGPNKSVILEYDIWLADWGMAKMMGNEKIWIDSLKAAFQTDLAIKMKSENDQIQDEQILMQSKKIAAKQNFKTCYDQRSLLIAK